MKAFYLNGKSKPHKAFELRDIPVPQPATGEMCIKVSHFGLNFADVMMRKGLYREAPPFPYVPGYDVAGEVVGVGAEVDALWIGKKVFALTRFGGYAEYVTTKAMGVAEIPAGISPEVATALATQYCTAMYAFSQCPNLTAGDSILVHAAAGGVGIALTQIAKANGLVVFGTVGNAEKAAFAKSAGVDYPILYRETGYVKAILEHTQGDKLMAVFNAVTGSTFKKDRKLLGVSGQHVLFGGAERTAGKLGIFSTLGFVQRMGLLIPIALMMKNQGITGVNMLKLADNRPELFSEVLQKVVELVAKQHLRPHVFKVYSPEELSQAHDALEHRGTIGKLVVKW